MTGWLLTYAVAQLVETLRWFNSRWCHWGFSLIRCFWPNYGPEVDSTSNRNEYQGGLLGGKGGPVRTTDNSTTFVCCLSRNSMSLNLLEPSWPDQACKGTALPFTGVNLVIPSLNGAKVARVMNAMVN